MTKEKTILIVDDNKLNRAILKNMLTADSFSTQEAANGQEAMEILKAPAPIALVLLDIAMPVMNGYDVLDAMTENGMIKRIPVIITTGAADEEAEVKCLERGASDYLKKPYNAEMVRHRVQSLMRLWDNARLISKVENDALTGVYIKEFFYAHAEALLEEHQDEAYDVVYADVDDFKMINARYGYRAGDDLLKYLARSFQRIAGKNGLVGRISGDIFVLLLPRRASVTQAELEASFEKDFKDAPVKGIQLKFGIYQVTDRSLPLSEMADRAKLAARTVKHQYRLHYAIYDEAMMAHALREHQLANDMEEALEEHQFVVYLQPKHETRDRTVSGAEALVRWIHPELGFISPGEFIPLFERNGFVTRIDEYMLREVCRLLHEWILEGQTPVPVSVNVSRVDFARPDLPDLIAQVVDDAAIPHELIHLEVTESAYTENPKQIIAAVALLRESGFLIEMDDFGSGYSSLNMLSELPIDILKLDMRFMKGDNDLNKGGKRNILSFIVSLSKWLQLPTIAEGVETEEEYALLCSMGCNQIQGYYFSRPMPAQDFKAYMLAHQEKEPQETAPVAQTAPQPEPHEEGSRDDARPLVLVAEDIAANREILKMMLEPDYRVVMTVNGREACDCLLENREKIACLLLDLLMPEMDGFQVLDFMAEHGLMTEVPVIITSEIGSNSELRALHLGASSFVGKPYNREILRHHVAKAVEEQQFWREKRDFALEKKTLQDMACTDELTGLLNRHGLDEAMKRFAKNEVFTLIMLDIDDLKQINDANGHATGDEAIRQVAMVLRASTRATDILARVGGDEFMLLLPRIGEADVALARGQEVCTRVGSITACASGRTFSCSAGITKGTMTEPFVEAYRRADEALYQAKRTNKGGCHSWKEEDHGTMTA